MIVQCEHCQTKYRIPDEKIKGKAAKVRCAKCNNTFTIHPESDVPSPPSPPAPSSAEAAPQVKQPSEPPPDSPPPAEPAPPPVPQEEPPPPPSPAQEEAAPEIPGAPPAEPEEESDQHAPLEDDLPAAPQAGFEEPPFPEDADGTGSSRPAHEFDRSGQPEEKENFQPEMDEFQIETTTREGAFEPPEPPGQQDAIPEQVPLGPPASTDDEMGWGNISLDAEPETQADSEGIGLVDGGDYKPPPPPPIFDEEPEETSAPSQTDLDSATGLMSDPSYSVKEEKPKKGMKGLLLILFLAALGAGGYFAYPKVMEIIKPPGEQTVGTLTLDKIQAKPLPLEDGNLIYTVRGVVRNESASSVGMVQVEAQFRNNAGTIVAKSTVFCGNIFEDKEIISGDLGKILADLQNELGQSLSNQGIQHGQDVPFLVILENPPPDVSKVTVTIIGFKETT